MTETAAHSENPIRLDNARKVFDDYIQLKPGEKVVFVTDDKPFNTDRKLISSLQQELKRRGTEFTEFVADDEMSEEEIFKAIEGADFIWQSWGMDDSDVDFYRIANKISQTKQRMIFGAGTSAKSLDADGAFSESREALDFRLGKIEAKLKDAVGLHIRTAYGTDLNVTLKPGERRWFKEDGVLKPGTWGNLPGGEVFTTPNEERVDGIVALPVLQDEISRDQGVDHLCF